MWLFVVMGAGPPHRCVCSGNAERVCSKGGLADLVRIADYRLDGNYKSILIYTSAMIAIGFMCQVFFDGAVPRQFLLGVSIHG